MKKKNDSGDFTMLAKTMFGLEEVLAAELLRLGAKNIEKHNRAVTFTGDTGFMYKANLSLRTALKILKPIQVISVKNDYELYHEIRKIDWEEYMGVDNTLAVDTVLNSPHFNHSQFVSQRVKDAVVDQFKDKYDKRPSVDTEHPDLLINIHISGETCTVSLDSSGESLHKRGYRTETNLAPLNEVLAAGMVMLSGWDKYTHFVNPMCGTGTLLIEAALYAANIPPGYYREAFAFEQWKDFDEELWETIYDSTIDKIQDKDFSLIGFDISRHVIKKAKENMKSANLDNIVQMESADMAEFVPPAGRGVAIINPPYGERMDKDDSNQLYKMIGDTLKQNYAGYDVWIISSNMEALKHVGLRPSRKITLFNGALECKFMKYEMYKGTKKVHKLK